MQVYIKQLLYQRSWKNNFFLSTAVSFPIFFEQKLKHFSYKKVDSVLTLCVAYIQTKNIWSFKPRMLYL